MSNHFVPYQHPSSWPLTPPGSKDGQIDENDMPRSVPRPDLQPRPDFGPQEDYQHTLLPLPNMTPRLSSSAPSGDPATGQQQPQQTSFLPEIPHLAYDDPFLHQLEQQHPHSEQLSYSSAHPHNHVHQQQEHQQQPQHLEANSNMRPDSASPFAPQQHPMLLQTSPPHYEQQQQQQQHPAMAYIHSSPSRHHLMHHQQPAPSSQFISTYPGFSNSTNISPQAQQTLQPQQVPSQSQRQPAGMSQPPPPIFLKQPHNTQNLYSSPTYDYPTQSISHIHQQQQQPQLMTTPPPSMHPYNQRTSLRFVEDPAQFLDMSAWPPLAQQQKRRLVRFWRENPTTLHCEAIDQEDYQPFRSNSMCVVSCIYLDCFQGCAITSVDVLILLEILLELDLSRKEDKNRLRRNLEKYKPITVYKADQSMNPAFYQIMSYKNPKPRNIEKDIKIFPWSLVPTMLINIFQKPRGD